MHSNNNKVRTRTQVLCAALLCAAPVASAQWEITPSIYVSALYTDNIGFRSGLFLFDDASGQTDDISYQISPRLGVRHEGPRWNLNSSYQYQNRRFLEFDGNNQEFHNLNLTSNHILVRDRLGVDFLANIQQQVIDRQLGIGGTTANRIGNLTDFGNYSVQPYFNFDLGSSTTGRISYRYGINEFDAPALVDSKNGQLVGTIGTQFGSRWSLGGTYTDSSIEFDTGREVSLARIAVDLGYQLTPRTRLVLQGGEDSNDLGSNSLFGDVQGSFWMAGVVGSLGTSTNYEVRVGEQFFGDSLLFNVERTRGRLSLNLSYVEQASTFGGGAINPQALLSLASNVGGIDLPNATQDVFVSNRLTVGVTYTQTRSSISLSVFNDDREFLSGEDDLERDDSGGGAQLTFNWEMSPDTRLTITGLYQQFTIRRTQDEPEDLRVQATWRRTLFEGAFTDIRLIHNQRQSNIPSQDFEENTVQIGFGYEF